MGVVDTSLWDLNDAEARKIGGGLAMCLVSNLTPEAAVAEWIDKNEALKELDRDTDWFTPMMETVAIRLLASATFGANTRL